MGKKFIFQNMARGAGREPRHTFFAFATTLHLCAFLRSFSLLLLQHLSIKTTTMMVRACAALLLFLGTTFRCGEAFSPVHKSPPRSSWTLSMAPRFDASSQRWVPASDEEGPEAGYGIGKTLLLQGPKPFLHRLFQSDDYEQAVLKFMANEKCSREEAQGNMDAYLRNPNDWAITRFESEKRGFKVDYTTIKTDQLIFTSIWSVIVVSAIGRVAYSVTTGANFYAFLPWYTGSV
jgi:hypothetical protein